MQSENQPPHGRVANHGRKSCPGPPRARKRPSTDGASLSRDLRIAVIDKNPLRAAVLEEGLRAAGHMSIVRIDDTADLLDRIHAIDPDVILIDLDTPSRDVLEQMFKVSRSVARPVAMFVDRSDAATIDAADRCRSLGLYRRRPPQGPCEADSRYDNQPFQCLRQAPERAGNGEVAAR